MLALQQVLEVKRLLDEGRLSRRAIALVTGVSRGSVNAIANGERGLFGVPPDEDFVKRSTVAERCPGCGGMVYMPCVLCESMAHREATAGDRVRAA